MNSNNPEQHFASDENWSGTISIFHALCNFNPIEQIDNISPVD